MKTAQSNGDGQPAGSQPENQQPDANEVLGNLAVVEADETQAGDAGQVDEGASSADADVTQVQDAGEETAEAKADDADESKDEPETDSDTDAEEEAEQRVPYSRFSKEVAKRHEAEERATAAETRLKELEAKQDSNLPLHPSYLSADELTLVKRARELEAEEADLFRRLDGWPEKNLTAEQVRDRYIEVRREASDVSARARTVYDRAHAQQMADMQAGRKLRLAAAKAPAKKADPSHAKAPVAKVMPTATQAPGKAVSAATPKRGMSKERFEKAGGTREAALSELEMLAPG